MDLFHKDIAGIIYRLLFDYDYSVLKAQYCLVWCGGGGEFRWDDSQNVFVKGNTGYRRHVANRRDIGRFIRTQWAIYDMYTIKYKGDTIKHY